MTNVEALIAKLIDEKKITGEEAVILLNETRKENTEITGYPYIATPMYSNTWTATPNGAIVANANYSNGK